MLQELIEDGDDTKFRDAQMVQWLGVGTSAWLVSHESQTGPILYAQIG